MLEKRGVWFALLPCLVPFAALPRFPCGRECDPCDCEALHPQ